MSQKSLLQQQHLNGLREKYPHRYDPNEMVKVHGYGPEDKQCGDCAHHIKKRMSKDYHKCDIWHKPLTNGPGTDIRVRWRACAKFEEAE
jgi:hypothetical protein